MRELMKKWIAAALVAAATGYAPAARGTDDFYQARLQEGRIALQTGSVAEAADLLRIGCFGLMDQPLLHSEGLVWLTIAQDRLNRAADADATLRRFLDVEKRFAVYDAGDGLLLRSSMVFQRLCKTSDMARSPGVGSTVVDW